MDRNIPHARCDDSLFFHVLSEIAQFLNHTLRFDKPIWSLFLISKGQTLLPVVNLAEPFRTGSLFFDERKK